MVSKVLTANRLSDGISVWLDAAGSWVESIQDSFIARHAEAVTALEATGKQAFQDNKVVDVNVVDVEEINGTLRPLRMRERIRAEGPSIPYAAGYNGLAGPNIAA